MRSRPGRLFGDLFLARAECPSAKGAEYFHREFGLSRPRSGNGKRYSWGYRHADQSHRLVVELLGASKIGVHLTDGYQFDPEQSTAAIVVPHPAAKYYAMLRTGGDE